MSRLAHDHLSGALTIPQSIAPMPHICLQLAELTAQPEIDAVRLVRLIQSDPGVVGELMRVANSPALRPRTAIVSLQQAVAWLGLAEVRNITLAAALRGEVFVAPGHEHESEALWREAWLGSLWAKEIARLRRKHVETAFMAGLMHRAGAALALKTLSQFEAESQASLPAPEFCGLVSEFETACAQVLTKNWCLPPEVQAAASEWRNFGSCEHADLAGTVNAAHLLAAHCLNPESVAEQAVLESPAFELLGVFPDERVAILGQRDHVRQYAGL